MIKQWIEQHVNGPLVAGCYHEQQWGIHLPLGGDVYQLHKDGTINQQLFDNAYAQSKMIMHHVFEASDEVIIVINSYSSKHTDTVYPRFFRRFVKNKNLRYNLSANQFSHNDSFVHQLFMTCHLNDLDWFGLLKCCIHEDFGALQPQLNKQHCVQPPDVFFIHPQQAVIVHVYDDRGCEVICAEKAVHDRYVEKFTGWVDMQVHALQQVL